MPQPVARLGDSIRHGTNVTGSIIQGSPNVFVDSLPVARIGDEVTCSIHSSLPSNKIISGSNIVFANGAGVARIGDVTTCGAEISTGSFVVLAD